MRKMSKRTPHSSCTGCLALALTCGFLGACLRPAVAAPAHQPAGSRIVNSLHHGERLLSALFFAGPPNPGSLPLYTRHPQATGKETGDGGMDGALAQMASVGLNTVKLSYWGHDGETDSSAPAWLFSQTRWPGDLKAGPYTEAEQVALARHFFALARRHGLLVAPMLEVGPRFPFYADFPSNLDPLVGRASWLLKHFGDEPN